MKFLPLILGMKLALIVAGAGAWAYMHYGEEELLEVLGLGKAVSLQSKELGEGGVAGTRSGDGLPEIPEAKAGLADYNRIRLQLETMREDVEEKMIRLRLATQKYEAAKKESDEQLEILRQERQLLDETLQKEKVIRKERVDEALVFIEKMEPRKAAPVLEAMDRDLVVQLFKKLKPKTVTKFLEALSPQKATEYMEYYTRIRSGREYELLRDLKVCESSEIPEEPTSEPAETGSSAPSPDQPSEQGADVRSGGGPSDETAGLAAGEGVP